MFSKYSLEAQQEMVDKSIMNGWLGLVEPKHQSQHNQSFKQQDKEREDREFEAISQRNIYDIIDEMEHNPDAPIQGVICE